MAMFVWPEGEVSGSVNVTELDEIQKGLKGLGKRKLAALQWPIESAQQLADQLAGVTDDDDDPAESSADEPEAEPPKKAAAKKAST